MADALATQLAQLLQRWGTQPNGPQEATQELLRIAEETQDGRAEAMAAWALGNTGNWPRAAEMAERAVSGGSVGVAPWVAANLQGQGDPNLRQAAVRLQSAAADAGVAVDFPNMAHALVNAGDPEAGAEAIDQLGVARPIAARAQWESIVREVEPKVREISDAAVAAATERDRVLAEIESSRQTVQAERESVERLVGEVGGLANKAGGLVLANDYGDRADKIEWRANWATVVSIVLAVLIALLAIVLAIDAGTEKDPLDAVLKKAPITVPFLLLNIYIARLASTFRDEAIKLRHIELQIRTANPFLGSLDPERRQAVLAMLALRFFPGQEVAGSGKSPSEPTDPGQAFAALLSQQAGLNGAGGKTPSVLAGDGS
jgi:hypothetical protein